MIVVPKDVTANDVWRVHVEDFADPAIGDGLLS
jgi:hypothetical protein